uniref:Uncharacterized protein n=2 Tax=Opuntia streptacantha TaxID=393608 RepID=A0A7C8YX87_OPUST
MEPNSPLKAEKLKNMARLMMLHFLIKGKPTVDLQRIKTRIKILAKTLGDRINAHHQALTCRSHDVHVPVRCPREYEFSCSSSPAAPPLPHVTRSKSKRHYPCSFYYYTHKHLHARQNRRVYHALLDGPTVGPEKSPLGWQGGLDYDVAKLQPFNCCADGDDHHHHEYCGMGSCVDRAAEEFIERFYKELRLQKSDFLS